MTRIGRPASWRTRATNWSALEASRTALVATASTRVAPSCRASVAMRPIASAARCMDCEPSCPVPSRSAPSRGASFISSTTVITPSVVTSATIWRIEFEPTSMAAIRRVAGGTTTNSPRSPPYRNRPTPVLDVLPLGEEDGVLPDVRRQIGDALEVPAHEQVLERGIDRPRVGHHVREQDAEDRLVQRVHLVVARAHVAPQRAVGPEEGVDRVAEHGAGATRHVLDLRIGGDRRLEGDEPQRGLGDVHGVVAYPLQVTRHLDRSDDEAEV